MHFNSIYSALFFLAFTTALPLDGAVNIRNVARTKSYAIVNVDGGSTAPQAPSTVVDDKTKTKTVEVTGSATTQTDKVTATSALPAPTTTSLSSSTTPTTSPQATKTASPSVVTVIITESSPPTSYYDNGLWHTSYAIKTWAAVTTLSSSTPALPTTTPGPGY